MEFWTNFAQSLPDWGATAIFTLLALMMFVTFVCSDGDSKFFRLLLVVSVGTAAWMYWGRYQ